MKRVNQLLVAICIVLFATSCSGQVKNAKTEIVKIYGNCSMCETNIEKAGTKKRIATVDWDENTKMAKIVYDSTQTNPDEIVKRIALAGYDSDKFLTPDDTYAQLNECCQYDRAKKQVQKTDIVNSEVAVAATKQEVAQLKVVFDNYFALKDALVKTDGNTASAKAKELLAAINAVEMGRLSTEEHTAWMKVVNDLAFDTEHIEETKSADHQRAHFTSLSKNVYVLIKVSKNETPIYYQHCPMYNDGKGADWLSKETAIKNPYYGLQMLTCGKTVETIR